jgi:menaquinone-dependent protoporphyrinogen oxidase
MKILVTAASRHGSTTEIASAIGAALGEAGVEPEVRPMSEVESVDAYDAVVVGSAVYVGKWLDEAKRFVETHREALRRRPVWLFSSGPLGEPPKPAEEPVDAEPMKEATGALDHRVFAGELAKDRLGFGERAVVRMVRAPYGDFRDREAIQGWARSIAAHLGTPVGARG